MRDSSLSHGVHGEFLLFSPSPLFVFFVRFVVKGQRMDHEGHEKHEGDQLWKLMGCYSDRQSSC